MGIKIDFNNMLRGKARGKDLVAMEEITEIWRKGVRIYDKIRNRRGGELSVIDLPYQETKSIEEISDEIRGECEDFVIVGIGGSSLGAKALHTALNSPNYNLLSRTERADCPRIHFLDNVDPVEVGALLESINPKKTIFNIITKSGKTTETLAHFLIIRDLVGRKVGPKSLKKHIITTTDPNSGEIRRLSLLEGYRMLEIPPPIGGRFSVFTPVGLLPAALSGINIGELLAGARGMDRRCRNLDPIKNPACMLGILFYLYYKKGMNIIVFMPYSNGLGGFVDWCCQLIAESLGKGYSLNGEIVNAGLTPVKAIGAIDQHSQLQLYMEGPYDKVIIFFKIDRFKRDIPIPSLFSEIEDIHLLHNLFLGELLNIEQKATEIAMSKAGRLNLRIDLPEIRPYVMGEMLFLFELFTIFLGGLFNINPFDQPGVEAGKILTKTMLQRKKKGAQ